MTSLNKYTSYKQTKQKASKIVLGWRSPREETGMVVARSSAGTIYISPMFPLEPLLMVHQLTGVRPDASNKQTNRTVRINLN